jgi:cytidylate kinase
MKESKNNIIIAIDGPAGSGKSTTAKEVAKRLQILHLDTGAMYRAITLKCLRKNISYKDEEKISTMLKDTNISFDGDIDNMKIFLDGEDVTTQIRSDEVTKNVSDYCAIPIVRQMLVNLQRKIAMGRSVVCEGRDIGTVVFPDAQLKFFMTASAEERAKRRAKDFEKLGIKKEISELIKEINERDRKDSSRKNSPLCKAKDAEEIDTTNMSFEQQVEYIVNKAKNIMF